ncbi:MAG: hypothetical protein IPG17_16830 [Sandaracinaceae bacterium]|nr:hypothetical protein [Sandaracinaceae bacterium]
MSQPWRSPGYRTGLLTAAFGLGRRLRRPPGLHHAGHLRRRPGTLCSGTSSQPRNLTSYSFDPLEQTGQCNQVVPAGGTQCNSATSRTYLIWVHRFLGTAPTCATYTISVVNGCAPLSRQATKKPSSRRGVRFWLPRDRGASPSRHAPRGQVPRR